MSFSRIASSRMISMKTLATVTLASFLLMSASELSAESTIDVKLRYQQESANGLFETKSRSESWQPQQTAVIVCDCWDAHHCLNAVRRLEQFAPILNKVLNEARNRGATIIHSPSDCMDAYSDHPARQRAIAMPQAEYTPHDVAAWCSVIPAEERGVYPIDQSDGGEDDDPAEHAKWRAKLESLGRNPNTPWKKQTELIKIDAERDFISDRGDEVWNILQQRGINNVILTGVHTNMCVLGRPFGLRQMARNGKNVVLMQRHDRHDVQPQAVALRQSLRRNSPRDLAHRAICLPDDHQRSNDRRSAVSIRRR